MTLAATHLEIPSSANGPDGSGNGGWSAGLLAAHVVGATGGVSASLRLPPPIGRPLRVSVDANGVAHLFDDTSMPDEASLVATAEPVDVHVEVPPSVRAITPAQAASARAGFPFRDAHPFPRCVACGTQRAAGTVSLELHCGPVAGLTVQDELGAHVPVFADAWTPTIDLAEPSDPAYVATEACWSALDCPSAAPFADPSAESPSVLARIAVRIDRRPRIGESLVLAAWRLGLDGRKQRSASVLLDGSGEVLAVAQALWIEMRAR